MGSYTFFDHTGDFGVDLEAETAEDVFESFARAFLDLLTDAPHTVNETVSQSIELEGLDLVDQLVAFGNELIYLFEVEGFLCARFEVDELDEELLVGTAHGERFDAERHPIARPMKAVTHHGAELIETETGARGRIIFDL